jgi:hypothetical protein
VCPLTLAGLNTNNSTVSRKVQLLGAAVFFNLADKNLVIVANRACGYLGSMWWTLTNERNVFCCIAILGAKASICTDSDNNKRSSPYLGSLGSEQVTRTILFVVLAKTPATVDEVVHTLAPWVAPKQTGWTPLVVSLPKEVSWQTQLWQLWPTFLPIRIFFASLKCKWASAVENKSYFNTQMLTYLSIILDKEL